MKKKHINQSQNLEHTFIHYPIGFLNFFLLFMRCQCYSLFHVFHLVWEFVEKIIYLIFRRDRSVVGFTTASTISVYHWSCEFESRSWRGVFDTTLCDKVCLLFVIESWCSPGTLVSSTNKTDRHNIPELLLKVALNTITIS